jgi:hypothetical protein
MKKFLAILMVFLAVGGFAFAAPAKAAKAAAPAATKSLFAPGNFSAMVGFGSGILIGGLDLYGGAEYDFTKVNITDTIPLTIGGAARVSYWGWSTLGYGYSYLGMGGFAIAHLSWKDVLPDQAWAKDLDSYIGLGLATYIYGDGYSKITAFYPGFGSIAGTNWFFAKNLALNLEGGYYGFGGGGRLALVIKL